jgi:predicted alpha/beta-hydrolase family hydrolase
MTRAPIGKAFKIAVDSPTPLSAIFLKPSKASACFVLAHGAGAGMTHPFMDELAIGLFNRGIATLRFNFPYMEKGSKRPDGPAVAQAAIRAAVVAARKRCRGMPLVAGGKSFGGRMTSQAQAEEPLQDVRALIFVGFPLHPPAKPSVARAAPLDDVRIPMLFVQGTRDKLAEPALLSRVLKKLGRRATKLAIRDADHGFHVPARAGRSDSDFIDEISDAISVWIARTVA